MNEYCIYIDINLKIIFLDFGIYCFGLMEGINMEFGFREIFFNFFLDVLFIICYK